MKLKTVIKNTMEYTVYSFTIMMLLFGIFFKLDKLPTIIPDNKLFPLFLMCFINSAFIALRDVIIPDIMFLRLSIGVLGNSVIVWIIGFFNGWMDFSLESIMSVIGICFFIYMAVRAADCFQNKKEEAELNRNLELYKKKRK